MRRLPALLIVVLLAGCGGSDDMNGTEAAPSTTTETELAPSSTEPTQAETSSGTTTDAPPRNYDELMARLPQFDVPASPDVEAYRKPAITSFLDTCAYGRGGVDKTSYVRDNARLLDSVPVFAGATFEAEFSNGDPEPGVCPEGLGPVLSYRTNRRYQLPSSAQASKVTDFYEHGLSGWMKENRDTRACDREFRRGDASLAVSSCGGALVLTADHAAHTEKRLPTPPTLPPRPAGEQYPISSEDFRGDPPPTVYETEPGTTCERILTADQNGPVTLIIPPPPGVTARIDDKPFKLGSATFDGSVVVEWSLGTVHGDCPPSELILSYPTITAFTIHEPVHSKSGVAHMPLLDVGPRPMLLRATAVSVDGHRSRQVAVLLR